MVTDKEALVLALTALESCSGAPHWPALQPTVTAIRQALAAPVSMTSESAQGVEQDERVFARIAAMKKPPAAQPAPVQEPVATKLETQQFNCFHVSAEDFQRLKALPVGAKLYTAAPTVQEPVHPDSARIDWLTNNPLDALDIFGHVKGSDAVRWIRQEIDNAILARGEA
jgi:hypothetical protein